LRIEELRNFYFAPDIIGMMKSRKIRWTGRVVVIVNVKNAFIILFGEREGKRQLG
jgi:hypothetical protein